MRFAVKIRLRLARGGPSFEIDAVTYDRDYDWDRHFQKAMESPATGYAKYSEFPGDVAFRIAGQSRGHFNGLWIPLRFRQALEKAEITALKGTPLDEVSKDNPINAEAIMVSATDTR